VAEGAPQCGNCGQRFAGARRTFTATTTSFRALEKRRQRAQKASEKLPYGIGDVVLSRYEVRDLVGSGPLGVVYRVFDQELDLDLALKVFNPGLAAGDKGRDAFQATVRKVRKLSQQNIVRLYDDAQDGDRAVVTMQLLEGLTLRKVLGLRQDKGQRFQVKEIEPIIFQIAMALSHAHRHTLHGDLKPENVLILPDVLKMTDFAVHEAVGAEAFVAAQREAGLTGYFAPEALAGGTIDARADLYSLGAIFYELVTGQAFAPGAPPPSSLLGPQDEPEGEGIDAFVARATAPRADDRFQSAEALIEALATYIDARELRSVDMRARPLLPEDVTRRVQAPAGLQDDDSVDEPFVPARTATGAFAARSATAPHARASAGAPEAEAERSLVEELGEDELEVERSIELSVDRSIEIAEESIDRIAASLPGEAASPTRELDFGSVHDADTPRPTSASQNRSAAPEVIAAATSVSRPSQGPWFLRSNVGFVVAITSIVLGIAGGAYLLRSRLESPAALPPVRQKVVRVGAESAAPVVIAQVEQARTTPTAAPMAMPVTEAPAPKTEAPAPQLAVAAVQPKTEAPAPKTEAPAPKTEAPAPKTEAPAPKTEAPAPKTEAPAPKPVVAAPAVRPEPAPKPAPPPPRTEAPATEPPVAPAKIVATSEKTSCPAGSLLVTTATFPKGSVKGRDVSGAEAVALARSGKAYCVDAHEYPGNGRTPKVNVTFDAAAGLCKAAGKRLCTDGEWQRTCGGAFPYGKQFDAGRCNTEDADGEARSLSATGRFPRCRSAVGAYDMSGNAAEWTADQTVRGGDYTSADEDAACSAGGKRAAGSARPSIGFRCCADLP